jgi:hypothetical protein
MRIKLSTHSPLSALLLLSFVFCSCNKANNSNPEPQKKDSVTVKVPDFNGDSAYSYVDKQVSFGPRIANSKAHNACGDYLIKEMERFGAVVTVQKVDLVSFEGKTLKARNIIASYNPECKTRILFVSHWDCRPWSDNDPNPANHNKPVDGANDGASGVGVLMEIGRQLQMQKASVGIDILFTDMEDYGEPEFYQGKKSEDSWCLGTQYWAKNPHVPGYHARYGVLLDMVGAPNATFPKESYSINYAGYLVDKIWNEAQSLGYGQFFVNKTGGAITDDHVPINQIIGIPTIDIIHFDDNGFGSYWHTQDDTMKNVDKNTLKAVGQTLLSIIYKEKE